MTTYRITWTLGRTSTLTSNRMPDVTGDPEARFIDMMVNGRAYTVWVAEDLRPSVITN